MQMDHSKTFLPNEWINLLITTELILILSSSRLTKRISKAPHFLK